MNKFFKKVLFNSKPVLLALKMGEGVQETSSADSFLKQEKATKQILL